jgi:LmbE family N-acetylglucosaminyl deacetylase
MKFQKFKNYLLDLNFLRKFFGWQVFSQKFTKDLHLKILKTSPSGRVLVLVPHPDDEVLSCGGTLAKHCQQGNKVKIVYLTGSQMRAKEAKLATQILGISDLKFAGFKDGELVAGPKEIKKITSLILNYKPNYIYTPSFLDPHPDHAATAKILVKAIKKSGFKGEIWSYEIWTPIFANRIIKIDDVFKQKVLAIKAYQSQLRDRGYLRAIKGLNSYRAGMFGAGEKAEAFFVCSGEAYKKILSLKF